MNWVDHSPAASALHAVTGDTSLYVVHVLEVPETAVEAIQRGFVEFWRRLLADGPKYWTGAWEVLLIELWPDGGLCSGVYTTMDRTYDEPGVFKVISTRLFDEYEALPPVGPRFGPAHDRLCDRWWHLLIDALGDEAIRDALQSLRVHRAVPVWGTLCNDIARMFPIDV